MPASRDGTGRSGPAPTASPIADGYGYAKGKGSDRKAQGVKAESERLGTWRAKSGAMLEARRGHDNAWHKKRRLRSATPDQEPLSPKVVPLSPKLRQKVLTCTTEYACNRTDRQKQLSVRTAAPRSRAHPGQIRHAASAMHATGIVTATGIARPPRIHGKIVIFGVESETHKTTSA